MNPIKPIFLFVLCNLFFLTVNAEVTLPAIISNHMVLQQDQEVTIWGWAHSGEEVTVSGSWSEVAVKALANKDGEWKVRIRTPKSGTTQSLTIAGENTIVVEDILIGEVWVCGGQSNMRWPIGNLGTDRATNDLANADYPEIRLFEVFHDFITQPTDHLRGEWKVCTPETLAKFSATGFYFGKNLYEGIQQPIGLISSNSGGTPIKTWMSEESLKAFGGFENELAYVANHDAKITKKLKDKGARLASWWANIEKIDTGLHAGFNSHEWDDSDWEVMDLPATWKGTNLEKVNGIVWFRKTFELSKKQIKNNLSIHLGTIDDIDKVWINGIEIGSTIGWDIPRNYDIPSKYLKKGENQIAIQVVDYANEGGFRCDPEQMNITLSSDEDVVISALANEWKYKVSYDGSIVKPNDNMSGLTKQHTTVLFNAMINPITDYTIAGFIWYQGESEQGQPIRYRTLFPALITEWRKQWDNPELPFYYVQISPYRYSESGISYALREAQFMTLSIPNTGMAVTLDIGNRDNIHPKNKHDVGERLSRWALAKTYGKDIVYSGPIYTSMTVEKQNIRLAFESTGSGLKISEEIEGNFQIAGADGTFINAQVEVDGNTLLISSAEIAEPKHVRYGWSNWVQGNLFNREGLPASSFRTDDLPIAGAK